MSDGDRVVIRNARPRVAGSVLMIGPTHGGRLLTIVMNPEPHDAGAWHVRTAWDASAAQIGRYRRDSQTEHHVAMRDDEISSDEFDELLDEAETLHVSHPPTAPRCASMSPSTPTPTRSSNLNSAPPRKGPISTQSQRTPYELGRMPPERELDLAADTRSRAERRMMSARSGDARTLNRALRGRHAHVSTDSADAGRSADPLQRVGVR